MPWTSNDAERHTRKATTSALQELWAKVANEKGGAQVDPKLKRWISSARSYECTAQLDDFSDAAKP